MVVTEYFINTKPITLLTYKYITTRIPHIAIFIFRYIITTYFNIKRTAW